MRYIEVRIKKLFRCAKVTTDFMDYLQESYLSNEELREYRDQLKLALEEIESAIEGDGNEQS